MTRLRFDLGALIEIEYLCREWNARSEPGRRLERVALVVVRVPIPDPGSAGAAPGYRSVLATRDCASDS